MNFNLTQVVDLYEGTHIRPIDFDFDRNNVRLWKTKLKQRRGKNLESQEQLVYHLNLERR